MAECFEILTIVIVVFLELLMHALKLCFKSLLEFLDELPNLFRELVFDGFDVFTN